MGKHRLTDTAHVVTIEKQLELGIGIGGKGKRRKQILKEQKQEVKLNTIRSILKSKKRNLLGEDYPLVLIAPDRHINLRVDKEPIEHKLLKVSRKILIDEGFGKLASDTVLLKQVIEEEKYVDKIIRKIKSNDKKAPYKQDKEYDKKLHPSKERDELATIKKNKRDKETESNGYLEINLDIVWSILKEKETILLDKDYIVSNIKSKKDYFKDEITYTIKINTATITESLIRVMKILLQNEGIDVREKYIDVLLNELIIQKNYVNKILTNNTTSNIKNIFSESNISNDVDEKNEYLYNRRLGDNSLIEEDISTYKMSYLNYLTDKEIIKTDEYMEIDRLYKEDEKNEEREINFNYNKQLGTVKAMETVGEENRSNEEFAINFNHSKEIETVKISETKIRNGHNIYCKRLEKSMECCPFTGISDLSLLIHSHIKPWSVSTDEEKLDGYNGLLLEYGYDMLFDRGWITFENDGTLLVSPRIPKELLSIYWLLRHGKTYNIYNTDGKRSKYLEYHRQNVFKG